MTQWKWKIGTLTSKWVLHISAVPECTMSFLLFSGRNSQIQVRAKSRIMISP